MSCSGSALRQSAQPFRVRSYAEQRHMGIGALRDRARNIHCAFAPLIRGLDLLVLAAGVRWARHLAFSFARYGSHSGDHMTASLLAPSVLLLRFGKQEFIDLDSLARHWNDQANECHASEVLCAADLLSRQQPLLPCSQSCSTWLSRLCSATSAAHNPMHRRHLQLGRQLALHQLEDLVRGSTTVPPPQLARDS